MTNVLANLMWCDNFERTTRNENEFMELITLTEVNSIWVKDVVSNSLTVTEIPSPLQASLFAKEHYLEEEKTIENVVSGTKLVLTNGAVHYNVSEIARNTLYETAKLNGSALGRMSSAKLSQTLNNGLEVAKGKSLMLIRQGKVMALHSSSEGGYAIMPITDLVAITKNEVGKRFGEMEFVVGYHSNSYTSVIYALPDIQNEMVEKYQTVLESAISNIHPCSVMPAVRLSASDTARSSAILQPIYIKPNGTMYWLTDGITVKHEKSTSDVYGIDKFEQEIGNILAKFNESFEVIEKMTKTEIKNPVNTFVGICNFLNKGSGVIPKKYADMVREELEIFTVSAPTMSMHDIYMSMVEITSIAKENNATKLSLTKLEESLARVLSLDWTDFDIGGTVSWGNK